MQMQPDDHGMVRDPDRDLPFRADQLAQAVWGLMGGGTPIAVIRRRLDELEVIWHEEIQNAKLAKRRKPKKKYKKTGRPVGRPKGGSAKVNRLWPARRKRQPAPADPQVCESSPAPGVPGEQDPPAA